jgi:5-methylcytosine-specific restriction endonuclease McrA
VAAAFVEDVDPRIVFTRDKGICGICRSPVEPDSKWEVDHVMPISRGGAHSYANVQLTHRRCNRQKHASVSDGQPEPCLVTAR